jgi:hypothetical protein
MYSFLIYRDTLLNETQKKPFLAGFQTQKEKYKFSIFLYKGETPFILQLSQYSSSVKHN